MKFYSKVPGSCGGQAVWGNVTASVGGLERPFHEAELLSISAAMKGPECLVLPDICQGKSQPVQERGCNCYAQQVWRDQASQALWRAKESVRSPRYLIWCFRIICHVGFCFSFGPFFFLIWFYSSFLQWECLLCAIVYWKYVTCLCMQFSPQLRGCVSKDNLDFLNSVETVTVYGNFWIRLNTFCVYWVGY